MRAIASTIIDRLEVGCLICRCLVARYASSFKRKRLFLVRYGRISLLGSHDLLDYVINGVLSDVLKVVSVVAHLFVQITQRLLNSRLEMWFEIHFDDLH